MVPKPRQFQLKQFMMNGEAKMQPPPMKKFGEHHREIFLSFFKIERMKDQALGVSDVDFLS